MPIKHHFQSGRGDNDDAGAVQPSHWDTDHDLSGFLALLDALAVTPNVVLTINGSNNVALVPTAQFAPSLSPTFTGVPLAPTPAANVNSNQIATMAALQTAIANLVATAPTTLDTLKEIATALGNDPNFSATITASLGNRLRIDAAGGYTVGQQAQGRSNLGLATVAATGAYADLTGKPTLGTAAALDVGTTANKVVQLDGSGKLPAVDGSQLTNVVASIQVGLITHFPATTAPSGWLPASGALVSRTTYAALWAYAQASGNITASDAAWTSNTVGQFSPGDGSTTFRVPDLRGEFVRGWDNGRGIDAGRTIGSWQADMFASHNHSGVVGSGAAGNIQTGGTTTCPTGNTGTTATGGSETRPRNVALLACIKY